MGKAQALNVIANDRFLKKPSMTMTMSLEGVVRNEPLDEELVDARVDEIVGLLDAENMRPLICDIVRYLTTGHIEWAVKMSQMKGIKCPAARFNSLCYKHLNKSSFYREAKRKRQYYRQRQFATTASY